MTNAAVLVRHLAVIKLSPTKIKSERGSIGKNEGWRQLAGGDDGFARRSDSVFAMQGGERREFDDKVEECVALEGWVRRDVGWVD